MHSVIIACTITTLITTYIYIASFKVQLSQKLQCSVSYRWGYLNTNVDIRYHFANLVNIKYSGISVWMKYNLTFSLPINILTPFCSITRPERIHIVLTCKAVERHLL